MCIAKNEEALRVDPHFAECYGNMANAWKVCFYHVHGRKRFLQVGCDVDNMRYSLFVLQEKGNIDVAIRYYMIAIEV